MDRDLEALVRYSKSYTGCTRNSGVNGIRSPNFDSSGFAMLIAVPPEKTLRPAYAMVLPTLPKTVVVFPTVYPICFGSGWHF
jgi:hypothetical protein